MRKFLFFAIVITATLVLQMPISFPISNTSLANFLVLESNGRVDLKDSNNAEEFSGDINSQNINFELSDDGKTWAIKYEKEVITGTNIKEKNIFIKIYNSSIFDRVQNFMGGYLPNDNIIKDRFRGPFLSPEGGHWGWIYKNREGTRCFLKKDFTVFGGEEGNGFEECQQLSFAPRGNKWIFVYKESGDWKIIIDGHQVELINRDLDKTGKINAISDVVFSPDGRDVAFWYEYQQDDTPGTGRMKLYLTYKGEQVKGKDFEESYATGDDIGKLPARIKYVEKKMGANIDYRYVVLINNISNNSAYLVSNLVDEDTLKKIRDCKFTNIDEFAFAKERWGFRFRRDKVNIYQQYGIYVNTDNAVCGIETSKVKYGEKGQYMTGPAFSPDGSIVAYGERPNKSTPWKISMKDSPLSMQYYGITCSDCIYDEIRDLKLSNSNVYWGYIGMVSHLNEARIFRGIKEGNNDGRNLGSFSAIDKLHLTPNGNMSGITYKDSNGRKGVFIMSKEKEVDEDRILNFGPYADVKSLTFSRSNADSEKTFWGFAFKEDNQTCSEKGTCWGAMINREKYITNSTLVDIKEIDDKLSVGRVVAKDLSNNSSYATTYGATAPYLVCDFSARPIKNVEYRGRDIGKPQLDYISFEKLESPIADICNSDNEIKDTNVSWGKLFFDYIDISGDDDLTLQVESGLAPDSGKELLKGPKRVNNLWVDFKIHEFPLKVSFRRLQFSNDSERSVNYKGYKISKLAYIPTGEDRQAVDDESAVFADVHIWLTKLGVDHQFFSLKNLTQLDLSFKNSIEINTGLANLSKLKKLETLTLVGMDINDFVNNLNVLKKINLKNLVFSKKSVFSNELKALLRELKEGGTSIYIATLMDDDSLKLLTSVNRHKRALIGNRWFSIEKL
ncbi:MAG: hypothetical protein HQK50_14305 [Oligoflexia bacterium]|nr:hypothetical protein [Oligoflexia bacterium]MBF0366742.1 hypothetical protein [Oligoflexia bacterium]